MNPYPQPRPAIYVTPVKRPRRRSGCVGCLLMFAALILPMVCMCMGSFALYLVAPPDPITILILGNDSRPGTGEDDIARTDSIMLLNINPQNHEISLLSVFRDLTLQTPNYGELPANVIIRNAELDNPGTGVNELWSSLEYTFGIEIDYYVRISFEGFVDIVDALGGVDIDVPKAIVDNNYPTHDGGTMRIEFQEGTQHMDGETALIYARTRQSDNDYYRSERQQQVIDAVISKLTNPLNVHRLPAVLKAFFSNVKTDMNIADVFRFSPGLVLYGRDIQRLVIDPDYFVVYGNQKKPDMEKLRPWIVEHFE